MNAYIKYLSLKDFVYFTSASFSRRSKGIENSSKLSKPKARKIYYKKKNRFNYLHLQLKKISNKSLIYI